MNLKQSLATMERRRLFLLSRAVKNSWDLAEIAAIDKILQFINERFKEELLNDIRRKQNI